MDEWIVMFVRRVGRSPRTSNSLESTGEVYSSSLRKPEQAAEARNVWCQNMSEPV